MRGWTGVFTGRVWAPVAGGLIAGGLLATCGDWNTALGYLAATLWTGLALLIGRRGATVAAPTAAWFAIVCWAAISASDVQPPLRLPAVDLGVGHNAVRQHVLTADGGCRLHGDRITWTADWLLSCTIGPSPHCETRTGKVTFSGVDSAPVYKGAQLRFVGSIVPPFGYNNPGTDSGLLRARRQLVVGAVQGRLLSGSKDANRPLRRSVTDKSSCEVRRLLSARMRRPAVDLGLAAALTLGNRGDLHPGLTSALRRTGTAHLLAVSGTHVGLLVGGIMSLILAAARLLPSAVLRSVNVHAVASTLACLFGGAYVVLAGSAASATRAMAMATAALVHWNAGRGTDIVESLGFAVSCILVAQPEAISDVGLQLSILGVLGVAWAAKGGTSAPTARWKQAFRASLCAWVTTSIVSIPVFGQITWVAPIANVMLIPYFAIVVLPLSMLTLLWSVLSWSMPLPAEVSAATLEPVWSLVALPLRWLSRLPLSAIPVSVPGRDVAMFAGIALLLGAFLWGLRRPLARPFAIVCLTFVVLLGPGGRYRTRPATGTFSVVFFDVGHGDAALVRFSDGTNMLIDGGGRPMDDGRLGAAVLLPALRALGVRSIDRMLLSHADADHENGLLAVARELRVDEFWYSGDPASSREHRALLSHLAAQGSRYRKVPARRWSSTQMAISGADVEIRLADGSGLSRNDRSLVVFIQTAATSLLLTGDIEADAESLLAARPLPERPLCVLKVPHHGSLTSSSDALFSWSNPAFAVVSGRPWAQHQLPAPKIVERYRQRNVPLWSTAAGAITLLFTDSSVRVRQGSRAGLISIGPASP